MNTWLSLSMLYNRIQYNTMKTFVMHTVVDCQVESEAWAVAAEMHNSRDFTKYSCSLWAMSKILVFKVLKVRW